MHNDGAQFMKKLSNTEGEFKKKRILLSYRFSYFRSFTYIITQNTTHSNICVFIGVIPQGHHLGRGRE